MFAEGQSRTEAGCLEEGKNGAGSEDGGSRERVSAVKVRILARQLTPLHASGNGRSRRVSSLATAGEVGGHGFRVYVQVGGSGCRILTLHRFHV